MTSHAVLPLSFISKLRYEEPCPWRVEILNETVAAEIAGLPADMQARFLRLAERVASAGLESLSEPHVKHLEGKLWELRLTGRDGIARALYVTAIGRRVVVVRTFVKKTQKRRALRSTRAAASKGDHMTIPFEKLKARLLANPRVKAEYDALAPEFEIAAELLRARLRAGLSQAELAARMGTSQSTIARLESGQTLPSTKTLLRYAEATGSRFHVRLSAA
jgi:phage-related protein/DNA-binding XRE family transcriptional regulator